MVIFNQAVGSIPQIRKKEVNIMRKTISLIISVLMVVSLLSVGVFAAEGTPINNAEDFKNMTADGTYYLAADITVDATYEADFIGTLDGNGKTVTVSVPMFKQFNGTIKNLTTAGKIEITSDAYVAAGAVACESKGATIENITNKATITVVGADDSKVGGIIGRINGADIAGKVVGCVNESAITGSGAVGGIVGCCYCVDTLFENCLNKGAIVNTNGSKNGYAAGGILGYNGSGAVAVRNCYNAADITSANRAGGIIGDARKSATIEYCTNDGNITLTNTTKVNEDTAAGGIVGHSYDTSTTVGLTVKNSVNNGTVSAYIEGNGAGVAGGIVGYVNKGVKSGNTGAPVTVENCINNGNVTAGFEAGGLIGYVFGSNDEYAIVNNCINNGDLASASWVGCFIAYTNHPNTTIKNSISNGKLSGLTVEGKTPRLSIVNLSSANIDEYVLENLFIADSNTVVNLSYGNGADNVKNNIPIDAVIGKDLAGAVIDFEGNQRTVDASNIKAITRGALDADFIAKANAAIGAGTFALKDGKAVFASLKVGSSLVETPDPVTPGTDPVTPPTTEPDSPVTGDNAYIVVVALAVVAVVGSACFFTRKKVND